MAKKVTQEELPKFNSYDEAKAYFVQKYGESNFEFVEKIVDSNEGTFYLNRLIVDPEAWKEGLEVVKQKGYYNNEAFIQSTQRIKIMQDGTVHL